MSLLEHLKRNGPSGFGYGSTAEEVTAGLSLTGRTILVTGCNSGIGAEALRVLALRGAHVLGTARTLAKAREACARVTGRATPAECELSDPRSIRDCVAGLRQKGVRLDAILCNAGIMKTPGGDHRLEQAHGIELQFFTNHVGHFMLVTGLLDSLAENGRVVMVSSDAHRMAPKPGIELDNLSGKNGYGALKAYGQSKMANLLFSKELARRFAGTGRTSNAVHPGVISTGLVRQLHPIPRRVFESLGPLVLKTQGQGAATGVFVAVHPEAAQISGAYLQDCNIARPRPDAEDPELARRLWEASEKIVAGLDAR